MDIKDNKEEVEETPTEEDNTEEEETEDETEDDSTSDDFDYKSEYEKLNKKDYAFEKIRKENKELKQKLEEKGDDEEDENTQDISKFRKEFKEEFDNLKKELSGDKIEKEINETTQDEFAQKLIRLNLEKYPEMSVKEAWALANAGKLETQMKEFKKTVDSKGRKGNTGGAGEKESKSTAPQLNPNATATIKRMGLKWDGTQFSKKDGRFALKPTENGELEQIKLK